jgi:hypothetical protein
MTMRLRTVTAGVATVALAGAGIAGGLAETSSSPKASAAATNSNGAGTASVIRTNLQSTVQVGGALGYSGSYVVVAPAGQSPQQVSQAQQTVTQDQNNVANDQTALSADQTSGDQAIATAQSAVNTSEANLTADQATEASACAGPGSTSAACTQAKQKVSQDQNQLSQADQQLSTAQSNLTQKVDQDQSKLSSDTARLQLDEAALTTALNREANPGTTYTSLPQAGQVISRDQAVYALDAAPVPLLYGSMPAYRAFWLGMTDGPDVGELTANLIALGFGGGLTQSNHFSSATAAAVEAWQRSLGLPQTGSVLLGEVVFEPGAIRVTSVTPSVGQAAGPGTVLAATSTQRVVTVSLSVTQEYLVKSGQPVTVVLPNGTSTAAGHVALVSDVATCPNGGGSGNGNGSPTGGSGSPESPTCSSSSGAPTSPNVSVTITLDDPAASGTLDEAPVNVDITTQQENGVLAVPITALLALQGGGYGVEVVSGGTTHLVGVQTGLFSNTLVEISGAGITEGTVVEVPSR